MALFIPKDRKSLFRQFLSGMYDAVVITDPNGYILEVNPRMVEYFGYETDDVIDRPIATIIPGLKPDVVNRIGKNLSSDHHVIVDANGFDVGGKKIACEVAVSQIDLTTPGDLIFTIRNVERRREYMNAFRAKANAFQISQAALFGCDAQGLVRDANPAFLELFGLKDIEEARAYAFPDLVQDASLKEGFKKAQAGESVTVRAEVGHGKSAQTQVEAVLTPNRHRTRNHGVVGSLLKV